MLLFLFFLSACAVLQIEECGCTSGDSTTNRENLWQCAIGASDTQFNHFSSDAASQYALNSHFASISHFSFSSAKYASQVKFAQAAHFLASNTRYQSAAGRYANARFQSAGVRFANAGVRFESAGLRFANARFEKRTSQVCTCLDSTVSCLQSSSCTSSTVVDSLCNWNYGRMFGSCTPCSGLVQSSDGLATSSDLMSAFQEYQVSLSSALVQLVPQISSFSASPNGASTLLADVTLAPGIVASDEAYNQIVYQLSHLFDLYPGTITWSDVPAGKRQTANQIILNFYDEQVPTSGSNPAFAPLVLLGLIACLLRLF